MRTHSTEATSPTTTEFLTPKQAAELLQLQPQTLALWRSSKRVALPFVKIGGAVRYSRRDIDRFLSSQTSNV